MSKRQMRSTSLEAYHSLDDLGVRQLKVLHAIKTMNKHGDYPTDQEITRWMGYYDPNKVRPRRRELENMGFVVEYGKRRCKVTDRQAVTWRATDLPERKL